MYYKKKHMYYDTHIFLKARLAMTFFHNIRMRASVS